LDPHRQPDTDRSTIPGHLRARLTARDRRARHIAGIALVALATLSVFLSTLAVWSHAVLLDTDRWVRTVGPLAADERLTAAVAVWGAEELTEALEVEDLAERLLPDRAAFLAAPMGDVVEGFLEDQLAALLASERFEVVWTEANRLAHRQAVAVLRGEAAVAWADEDQVVLNLVPVLVWGLESLDERGLLPGAVEVPDVDASTPPVESVDALSDSLGVDLPAGFGQIVVFESDDLRQAQRAVATFDRLVVLILMTTVVLGVAAVAVSLDRTRTTVVLGVASLVTVGATLVLIDLTEQALLGRIDDPAYRSAAAAVTGAVLSDLRDFQIAVVVGAVVVAAGGWAAMRGRGGRDAAGHTGGGPISAADPVG
jgi:hypothetical protein